MQEEELHEGSPQMNWVFEFMSQTKFGQEIFLQATFFQKSIMLGRAEHKLKI